jgi:hypothetical protein
VQRLRVARPRDRLGPKRFRRLVCRRVEFRNLDPSHSRGCRLIIPAPCGNFSGSNYNLMNTYLSGFRVQI